MKVRRVWRRFHGWWLLMAAAGTGAVASLVGSWLPALAGSVLVAVVSGLAGTLAVRAERSIERDALAESARRRRGAPQRVRDLDDPLKVGVHPARSLVTGEGAEDRCPPFVRRDCSAELEDSLRVSGFVLVVGESTAGKTRAAYEAMRVCLPDHTFVRPRSRQDLPEVLGLAEQHRQSVVWLDDLELYLGSDGLTAEMLSPLLAAPRRHTVVLATMRTHERARYSPRLTHSGEEHQRHALRLAGEVLRLAREVRVERMWSQREQDRAADSVGDSRIVGALNLADRFGLAQYLAAGPQLFQEWQDAWGSWPQGKPRGAALVAAAVDVRRAGYHLPVPAAFLRTMHESYLDEPGRAYLRLESWEEALAWATEALHSTSSLIMPAGNEHYVAFDYLADAVDEAAPIREVPSHAWEAVTAFVPAADMIEVAWSAFLRHRLDIAEHALSRAVAAGHHEAAIEFAVMMGDSGRFEDMVAWLERAVDAATAAGASPEEIIQLRDQTAFWLGAHHHGHGDPGRAHSLALAIVTDSSRLLGADHPQTLQSRATLIRQIGELGRPEEALNMAQELAADTGRLHGTDHRMHYAARFEVAVWTRFSGDPRRAVRLWQDLIDDSLITGAADIRSSLRNLASALDYIGDPELNSELAAWLETLADRTLRVGRTDDKVVVVLFGTLAWWVGGRGDGDGDTRRARDIAQWTIETGGDMLGPDDADVLWARIILAHQEGRLGSITTARTLSSEALEAATRIYGDPHFVTRQARIEVDRWAAPDHPEQTP